MAQPDKTKKRGPKLDSEKVKQFEKGLKDSFGFVPRKKKKKTPKDKK